MNKAEKFIQEHTRNCSNDCCKKNAGDLYYFPWLTPDQARRAVEIAREEIYEQLRYIYFDKYKIADEESYRMGCPYDYIDTEKLINDIKQTINDE